MTPFRSTSGKHTTRGNFVKIKKSKQNVDDLFTLHEIENMEVGRKGEEKMNK